jgi:hypothetical protein
MDRMKRYVIQRPSHTFNDGREIDYIAGCDVTDNISILSGVTSTILTVTAPDQQIIAVTGLATFLDDVTGVGFITWRLKINGIQVPNYGNITNVYSFPAHLLKMDLVVPEASVLTVEGINSSGFTYRVGAGIYGIFGTWRHLS